MPDDLNLSMFRAYDIRSTAAALTPALAERLATALARYVQDDLAAPGVVVARDARAAGPGYLYQAAEVFARAGLEVLVLPGVSSSSLFYFTAMQHPELAAVMYGASHNPAGDTGQKVLGPGVRPIARHIGPAGGLDRIEEYYRAGAMPPTRRRGGIRAVETIHDYVDYSLALAGVAPGALAGTPVLHDYLFGAGGREMMLAFDRAGAALMPLHFVPDGRFPLGDPNPVKPEVVAAGLAALQSGDYLLGTFFDGDADRIDFYAGGGQYLASSFVYAAILPFVLEHFAHGVGVFADLKSNPLAVIEMAKAGVTVGVIRNGHSQIKAAMLADPRMVGAVEESAHFYQAFTLDGGGPYCTENTLYIALLVTRAWRERPARFAELLALQGRTAREREWGHYFPTDQARAAALAAVERHFADLGAQARAEGAGGLELEATLMRRGLPFEITADTRLAADWLQISQRISQSENGLARWEVVGASRAIVEEVKAEILSIVAEHGGSEEHRG